MDSRLIERFTAIVGPDRALTAPADCLAYGYDNSREQAMPELVLFALDRAAVM
jgi:D-lactate dehydrogenase